LRGPSPAGADFSEIVTEKIIGVFRGNESFEKFGPCLNRLTSHGCVSPNGDNDDTFAEVFFRPMSDFFKLFCVFQVFRNKILYINKPETLNREFFLRFSENRHVCMYLGAYLENHGPIL
jgi:hypothetical protein